MGHSLMWRGVFSVLRKALNTQLEKWPVQCTLDEAYLSYSVKMDEASSHLHKIQCPPQCPLQIKFTASPMIGYGGDIQVP